MKKWYQSPLCKGLLILAAHISAAALVVCIGIWIIYPGQNYGQLFFDKGESKYEDTRGFANDLQNSAWDILNMSTWKNALFTEGRYNPDKVIDVKQFDKDSTIATEPGELSFYLKDLIDLQDTEDTDVLVCEKPDGKLKYDYFTVEQFLKEVRAKGYRFPAEEEQGLDTENSLSNIEYSTIPPSGEAVDKDGKQVYSEVWFMESPIYGTLKTVSGKTMLELANESETWNGKLYEMYSMISSTAIEMSDYYSSYADIQDNYENGETNISFLYVDYDNGIVESNIEEYENYPKSDLQKLDFEKVISEGKYVLITPKLAECRTNLPTDNVSLSAWKDMVSHRKENSRNYKFAISVDTKYPIQDRFYEKDHMYTKYMSWVDTVMVIGCISAVLLVICFIWLTAVAGRSNAQDTVALVFFDKWKTELWLCFMMAGLLALAFPMNMVDGYMMNWDEAMREGHFVSDALLVFGAAAAMACACILTVYLSLVRVLKAKTLWKNSITKMLCRMVRYIWQNRSGLTKLILTGVGLFLVNFMVFTGSGFFILLAMVVDVASVLYLAKLSIERTRIKKGIMKIAAGDTEYKIPLNDLTGDNKDMAEMVNHIGEGIQTAVEKSLKDERLKTDLITNVSHDIKTPLTSIINYVGLLKQEHFDDPKIQRYLDILDQKSQRLKTLTEDVVEASKISSGNINLEFINLNLVEMIHQTTGEFAEKFEKKNLTAVVTVPDEPAIVRVDGRRMWRVIENVYNNAAKYAMPGTRVYVDLSMNKNIVLLSLKNVSEYPLNITADELMERFTRGDVSRTTEGSGLGLSIAQNLTKMQGGEFKLYVDGDLFKVMISFPRIRPKVEKPEWTRSQETYELEEKTEDSKEQNEAAEQN